MKVSYIIAIVLIVASFSGCGDSKDKKTEKQVAVNSKTQDAPKIEVVENKNAKAIKVKEKKSDKSQSKSYYLGYNINSEYDQNAQPANADASVRIKPRTAIDANMYVRSPYEEVKISMLVKKLSRKFIVKCSACHNDYANGIIGPSLLSKNTDEIFNKIAEFKSGKKNNPLMNDLVKMMSDDEIRELANEIDRFNKKIKSMRGK